MYSLLVSALAAAVLAAPAPSPPPTLTLKGHLSQINSTHLRASLTNDNPHDLVLLSWNSLLVDAAEYHSFTVKPAAGGAALKAGDKAARFWYDNDKPEDSFMTLKAGACWTTDFDVTRAFNVPSAGAYNISIQSQFPGMKATNEAGEANNKTHLGMIDIESPDVTVNLAASTPTVERRATTDDVFAGCEADPGSLAAVQAAITGARYMANDAFFTTNLTMYYEYFGISSSTVSAELWTQVVAQVVTTFASINNYDPETNSRITYNCDANNSILPLCVANPQVRGFYQVAAKSVNFCKNYFTGQFSSACIEPNAQTGAVQDMVSTVFHELSHDTGLAPQVVLDFPDTVYKQGNCYNYFCAVAIAQARNSSALPERSAINLQEFAQTARHRTHPTWPCVAEFVSAIPLDDIIVEPMDDVTFVSGTPPPPSGPVDANPPIAEPAAASSVPLPYLPSPTYSVPITNPWSSQPTAPPPGNITEASADASDDGECIGC